MEENFRIHPITDWKSKNSVATSFVELFNVVEEIKITLNRYKALYGAKASGSGLMSKSLDVFDAAFKGTFSVVNDLKESTELDDILSDLIKERDILLLFVEDNSQTFQRSVLATGNIARLFDSIEMVIGALSYTITKIEQIVSYHRTVRHSGRLKR